MHTSGISQDILVTGSAHFENELGEESTWALHNQPCHVHLALDPQGDLHPPSGNFLRRKDPEPALILTHIYPVMK